MDTSDPKEEKSATARWNTDIYKEEAYERLAELESALLELENSPGDPALVDSAFRAMHTIKGSGGMFGFEEIVDFTHNIETVFDRVRAGTIPITSELIALTLSAHDQIGKMLEETDSVEPSDMDERSRIMTSFKSFLPQAGASVDNVQSSEPSANRGDADEDSQQWTIYRIRFKPHQELFATGTNPLLLLSELREMGNCKIIANLDLVPLLDEIDPEKCYVWWDIILHSGCDVNAIKDVFIFVEDSCDLSIQIIDTDAGLDDDENYKRLGEILIDRGDLSQEALEAILKDQKPIGERLKSQGLIGHSQLESALIEQQAVKENREKRKKTDTVSSIRVNSLKLDKLVDLVGELVTAQARLSQIANTRDDSSVLSIAEEIERLTAELRDNTMNVRMLTFGTTFNKFKRLVRDLSSELGREVDFVTEGAETELDKNVIEQLNDPLVHILRNAVDHGLEPPGHRVEAGKPEKGVIRLSASHSGAHVLIRISDDGKGLDAESIKKKALERGLISSDANMTDKDCFFLIFEPGFSTAQKVTNVSGRGVGMDVVKKAIEDLRGSVDIESKKGVGTTITLKLPLTLAIIDGLLVTVGSEFFVIPLSSVEECIELTESEIRKRHGRHYTNVRDQIVPYIRLRDQFNVSDRKPEIEQVVITEIDGHRIGFVVDKVIGQHQTVIKNLSRIYKNVDTISGATIMADGTVALIIDINRYVGLAEKDASGTALA